MNKQTNKISAPTAKLIRLGDGAYITVVMNEESLTLRQSESPKNFDLALKALKSEDWESLYKAMRPVIATASKLQGVEVRADGVYWNGQIINNVVANRIIEFANQGLDHKPLCMFLNKIMANPSRRAVEELYKFLEHKYLPITENGNFLAYKGVNYDWYSKYRGSLTLVKGNVREDGAIYNGIGEEVECPRNQVDDNKEVGCGAGLHAGSLEYAVSYAGNGKVVIVEINPKDVVSIPLDSSYQKLRTCAYKVVAEYEKPLENAVYESGWATDSDKDYEPEVDELDDSSCSCGGSCGYGQKDIVLQFECPESSWIECVNFYDNNDLEIVKVNNDSVTHLNVPASLAHDFENFVSEGGSAGIFYNRKIKGVYSLAD